MDEGKALFFDWFDDLSVADRELVIEYLASAADEIKELWDELKSGGSHDTDLPETETALIK